MSDKQNLTPEEIAQLAGLFDLLARFDMEQKADGIGQANPANRPLDAKLNRREG